jgi:hypothetical protein
MGSGRTLHKISQVRPIKSDRERRRRQKVQVKRLIGFGMKAEDIAKLNPRQVTDLLKRPAKLRAQFAGK